MKAIFTVSKQKSRPESLSEALQIPEMQLVVARGTMAYSILSGRTSAIYTEAWRRVELHPSNVINIHEINEELFRRIESSEIPIGLFTQKSLAVQYFTAISKSSLYIVKEPLRIALPRMIYGKDFKYTDVFNNDIVRLQEAGKNN